MQKKEGIYDAAEPKKATRQKTKLKRFREKFHPSVINNFYKRVAQRNARFIRWLRDDLHKRLCSRSLLELADALGCKLP